MLRGGAYQGPVGSIHPTPRDTEMKVFVSQWFVIVLDEAREAVIRIGGELRQRAMYFEVRDYDGVQILEIPHSGF